MYLTREMVEALVQDPEQFEIVNRTDHAEWFGGMKEERVFQPSDVWVNTPGIVFETGKGLFAASPEGKIFRVRLDVPVGLAGKALHVALKDGRFVVASE